MEPGESKDEGPNSASCLRADLKLKKIKLEKPLRTVWSRHLFIAENRNLLPCSKLKTCPRFRSTPTPLDLRLVKPDWIRGEGT